MKFIRAEIPEVIICEPIIHYDNRGYFMESFRLDELERFIGHSLTFCQENESCSVKSVARGLHYQLPPFAQSKLVRVTKGKVLDIAVDIRKGSPTFGKYVMVELSDENKKQLFIPRGFAHGFIVLSDEVIFSYKVDNYYSPQYDRGISLLDKSINLPIENGNYVLSDKDIKQPLLGNVIELFDYKIDYYKEF